MPKRDQERQMDYTPDPNLTLEARVVRIETMLGNFMQQLLGNGQPGELAKISSRVTALEQAEWRRGGESASVDKFWGRIPSFVPWIGFILASALTYYVGKGAK